MAPPFSGTPVLASSRDLTGTERAVRQDQHLAVAAAALGMRQRLSDLFDRVGRLDRGAEYAITQFDCEIGVDRPHLLRAAPGEASAEIEAGQDDVAKAKSRPAHVQI